MERKNVMSLATVQTLFNKFFRNGQKFYSDLLLALIVQPDSRRRVFGITTAGKTGGGNHSVVDPNAEPRRCSQVWIEW